MRTRDFLFGLGMALLCSQVVNAQENRQRHQRMSKEEMQEMQMKRMVKELKLDEATTAKFTPIYKEYQEAIAALQPERPEFTAPQGENEGKDVSKKEVRKARPQLTDEQIDKMMEKRFEQAKKQTNLRETYYKKFRTILSAEQARKVIEPAQHQSRPQMHREGGGMNHHRPQGGNFSFRH
ncbi:MAG: hypothetical protein J6J09_02130 [Phocaeicola sp.]|nr:hypothetical protein [Phocaeicola sp.]